MKKSLFIAFCFILGSSSLKAQYLKFGAGLSLTNLAGGSGYVGALGVGVEGTGVYEITESIHAFGQAGIHRYFTPSTNVSYLKSGITSFPVLVGARYNFRGFHAGAGLGYTVNNVNFSGFTYSPQIGYSFRNFDFIGHLATTINKYDNMTYMGVKVFYIFNGDN